MSINGISSQQIYVNKYNMNSNNKVTTQNSDVSQTTDRIEISALGKSLNQYSLNMDTDNSQKIEALKSQIANGTYNVDAKVTAKSMLDAMKGDNS